MMRLRYVVLVLLAMAGCSSTSEPQNVAPEKAETAQWAYEEKGIVFDVQADSQLNLFDESPHTLLLCAYQLEALEAFDELSGDEEGLYDLLECKSFDPTVKSTKKIIIHPGQNTSLSLDRVEGVKYIAVVTGYFSLEAGGMIRRYNIPVMVEKSGLFYLDKTSKVGVLEIVLALGQTEIETPDRFVYETQGADESTSGASQATSETDAPQEEDGKSINDHIESVQETTETVEKGNETFQKTKDVGKGLLK